MDWGWCLLLSWAFTTKRMNYLMQWLKIRSSRSIFFEFQVLMSVNHFLCETCVIEWPDFPKMQDLQEDIFSKIPKYLDLHKVIASKSCICFWIKLDRCPYSDNTYINIQLRYQWSIFGFNFGMMSLFLISLHPLENLFWTKGF